MVLAALFGGNAFARDENPQVILQNFDKDARKIIEKYELKPTAEMMGRLDENAIRACERQGGFVIDAYNRTICNFKTRDANQPCGPTQECQGMCLQTSEANKEQGINISSTNNNRYPGRCSVYSHPVGCAVLFTGEKWCSSDQKRQTLQRQEFLTASAEEQLRAKINIILDTLDEDLYEYTSRRLGINGCDDPSNTLLCSRDSAFKCLKKGNTTILRRRSGYDCALLTEDGGHACSVSEECEGHCVLTKDLSTEDLVSYWETGNAVGECSATKTVAGCIRRLERQGGVPRVLRVCFD